MPLTHKAILLAQLNQLRPLSEWGIDKLRVLELIRLAEELDKQVKDLEEGKK